MKRFSGAVGKAPYGPLLLLWFGSAPLHAQTPLPGIPEVVVYGDRAFFGKPERTLTEDRISSYGSSSVGELLDQIEREFGGRREPPVYLIDGKRISGLGDIDSYPPEAIRSIQVFAPGSASGLIASTTRRAINIVLKEQVRVTIGRAAVEIAPTSGSRHLDGDVGVTDIKRPRRFNMTLRARHDEAINESDRDVVQVGGAAASLGQFRTLRPAFRDAELRASLADQITPNFRAIVSARLAASQSVARLGVAPSGQARQQDVQSRLAALEIQTHGDIGKWLIAVDSSYDLGRRRIRTDNVSRFDDALLKSPYVVTRTSRFTLGVEATRPLFDLLAGPVTLSLRARSSRDGIATRERDFVQWLTEAGASLHIPIASSASGSSGAIGDLSLGVDLSRSRASRVGALTSSTLSFQWQPNGWLQLAGSATAGSTPPGVDFLAGPLLLTPGVRYFDPLRGETIDVTQLSGGNPDLGTQRQANRQLTVTLSPLGSERLQLTMAYEGVRDRDSIIAFPQASDLLLRAFPGRFRRAFDGALVEIDARPISVKRRSEDLLRFGLQFDLPPLGTKATRFHFAASHTVLIKSDAVLTSAFAPIDLLGSNALGIGGETSPRHVGDVSLDYAERGLGIRLTGRYEGVSSLDLPDDSTPNKVRFAPLATFDMRLFIEGHRLLPDIPWLKGARLSATIVNITNAQQDARDPRGATPLRYQPAYRDPKGRSFTLEFRKRF